MCQYYSMNQFATIHQVSIRLPHLHDTTANSSTSCIEKSDTSYNTNIMETLPVVQATHARVGRFSGRIITINVCLDNGYPTC